MANHPAGALTCRTQKRRPALAPPTAVFGTTNEQSPSASDVQVAHESVTGVVPPPAPPS